MRATACMVGAGATTAGALSSIGSDLSVSISFQVASELIDGGKEAQLRDDELVGVVLALSIVLAAIRSTLDFARRERLASKLKEAEADLADGDDKAEEAQKVVAKFESQRTLLDFGLLFVGIATRISLSVTVQLLAASARSRQSARSGRVLTLVSLSVFFVWLESGTDRRHF